MISRRRFLLSAATFGALLLRARRVAAARPGRGPHHHPTPRPGITADKVLTAEQLGVWTAALPAFDEVRQIPEIVDGIRCNCGCAEEPAFYSLLSCYEGEGMARMCDICQGQGRL